MSRGPRPQLFRLMMAVMIAGLVVSGVTAFPLTWEVERLARWLGLPEGPAPAGLDPDSVRGWLHRVREGLRDIDAEQPWMKYGTDWLAFGHLAIACFFVGPLLFPRRDHRLTLLAGVAACVGVVPLALIAGPFRGIPFGWRLIDCAFGVVGIVPLLVAWRVRDRSAEP